MTRSIRLTVHIVIATVFAAGAQAQTENETFVRIQLLQEVAHLEAQNLQRDGAEQIAEIENGKAVRYKLQLSSGVRYAIAAACARDCRHVQISLQSPDGAPLLQSPEKQKVVIVGGAPDKTAGYLLELSVPGCADRRCHAGFVVLRQLGAQAGPVSPTRLDAPAAGGRKPATAEAASSVLTGKKSSASRRTAKRARPVQAVVAKADVPHRRHCQFVRGIGRACFKVQ